MLHKLTSNHTDTHPPVRPSIHPSIHPFHSGDLVEVFLSHSTGAHTTVGPHFTPQFLTAENTLFRPPLREETRSSSPARVHIPTKSQAHESPTFPPGPCRAAQRRAVRHEVLLVPLTDRPARVAPCLYCLSPCRHCCYCRRAGPLAYCEPGLVENPSLREFNNNQSPWFSPGGMYTIPLS